MVEDRFVGSGINDPDDREAPLIPPGAKVVVFDFMIRDDDAWTVRCNGCDWVAEGARGRPALGEATMTHRNDRRPDTWVPDYEGPDEGSAP